jgi:large subunit ribosomal protein L9
MATLEIILKNDVSGLGEEGDVKKVKAGFARNYLIPKGYAVQKNKVTLMILEREKKAIEARKEEKRSKSKSIVERLSGVEIVIKATAAENDKLYGSITAANIADELAKQDFDVDKRKIDLEHPIKVAGEYDIKVKLYEGITASIKVKVETE